VVTFNRVDKRDARNEGRVNGLGEVAVQDGIRVTRQTRDGNLALLEQPALSQCRVLGLVGALISR